MKNEAASLIAIHKGRYFQDYDGISIGPGPFIEALEYATGKKATILGKPTSLFFHHILNECGVRPGASIMIGDVGLLGFQT